MEIKIGISNKHVHLTKETFEMLFDGEITVKKELKQIGEFASNQTLTLVGPGGQIENVRVVGPFRAYNQVEISKKDSFALGYKNVPVRQSGDLDGAEEITLKTDKAEVTINGCIIAGRHVHVNTNESEKLGLYHNDKVKLIIGGEKSGVINAVVKVSDTGVFETHLDTDDACAFLLNNDQVIELEKC